MHDGASVAPGRCCAAPWWAAADRRAGVRLGGAVVFDAPGSGGAVVERSIIGFGSRIGPRAHLIRDG